jgi:hypothetical protein
MKMNSVTRTGKTQSEARMLVENDASRFLFHGKNYRVYMIRYSGNEPNVSCTIQYEIED